LWEQAQEHSTISAKKNFANRRPQKLDDIMIYYNQWLSNTTDLQVQRNEASAARLYAGLEPIWRLFGWAASVGQVGWQHWQARSRKRAVLRELIVLDDHQLNDLGISRSEIRWVVERATNGQAKDKVAASLNVAPSSSVMAKADQSCEVIPMPVGDHEIEVGSRTADDDRQQRLPLAAA
jgi:uncharacterized protein YjiS (DUF1127 family)